MTSKYRTIDDSAIWTDVSVLGRLRFLGPDAATFLHALVTNEVAGLAVGQGTYAAWLTPQGRMITDLRLLRTDEGVLAAVPAGLASTLQSRFDQLIFAERVQVEDVTAATRVLRIAGGRAADAVAAATGTAAADLGALPVWGHRAVGDVRIVRTDDTAWPTFEVWMPADADMEAVTAGVGGADAAAMFDALRIEAGRPLFGVDMTADTIPLEAGLLDRAISQTKGCYVGQEVVVRILHRGGGRVVRRLMRLTCDPVVTEPPGVGTEVLVDGRVVGTVTSAAVSPATGRTVALAMLHRDAAVVGQAVSTAAGAAAEVTAPAG